MLYNFKQWQNEVALNESKSIDNIMNWLSTNFGGSVSKIDALLAGILSIEEDYMKEWNDIQTEIDSLEVQKAQIKSDPAEAKKLERMISRNQKLLDALSKKRRSAIDAVEKKVEDATKGKQRLISYWNMKKSEAESDVAEKLYKMAKNLTDSSIADELYDKYKDAALMAKKKDDQFRSKFGDLKLSSPSTIETGDEKITKTLIGKFIQSIRNLLRDLYKETDRISRLIKDLNQTALLSNFKAQEPVLQNLKVVL
jgi:hypothetical protein